MSSNSTETESKGYDYYFIFFQCLFRVILGLARFLFVWVREWPRICFNSLLRGPNHTLGIQTATQTEDNTSHNATPTSALTFTPIQRHLIFETPELHSNQSLSVATIRNGQPHLPRFWPRNPGAFFQVAELMFQQHGLTDEQSKFTATIAALSHDEDVIQIISDVLQKPDSQHPYSIL